MHLISIRIVSQIYDGFSLFIVRSLILAFTNGQIKKAQGNERHFHTSETKTLIIFQPIGLVGLEIWWQITGSLVHRGSPRDDRQEGVSYTPCPPSLSSVFLRALQREYNRNLWEGETLTGVCFSSPIFNSSVALVNSQLVCLLPVRIPHVIFICNSTLSTLRKANTCWSTFATILLLI